MTSEFFFKDVEDGLVTRWAFAQLPDMFGTDIPDFQPYTATEENEIVRIARMLDMASGKIYCQPVNDAISQWLNDKKQLAIANDSRAIDTIRRRSAVIGFRAGYLAALLNGSAKHISANSGISRTAKRSGVSGKSKKEVSTTRDDKSAAASAFALYIAEYVFQTQLSLFGDKFEAVASDYESQQSRKGSVRGLLQLLPTTFTRTDLMALRAREGKSTDVRVILSRWVAHGFIRKESDTTYTKILANCV